MIKSELLDVNGKQFTRQYSNKGVMIERDGTYYQEAIDPVEYKREYKETNIILSDSQRSGA